LFVFSCCVRALPPPPLFPYTTLFRSGIAAVSEQMEQRRKAFAGGRDERRRAVPVLDAGIVHDARQHVALGVGDDVALAALDLLRSEEHTSELQSRENLVCRLLLEKKK